MPVTIKAQSVQAAVGLLALMLKDGKRRAGDVVREANSLCIPHSSLMLAKKELGVIHSHESGHTGNRKWYWSLPDVTNIAPIPHEVREPVVVLVPITEETLLVDRTRRKPDDPPAVSRRLPAYSDGRRRPSVEVDAWLEDALEGGPRTSTDLYEESFKDRISPYMIRQAKLRLGYLHYRIVGQQYGNVWYKPGQEEAAQRLAGMLPTPAQDGPTDAESDVTPASILTGPNTPIVAPVTPQELPRVVVATQSEYDAYLSYGRDTVVRVLVKAALEHAGGSLTAFGYYTSEEVDQARITAFELGYQAIRDRMKPKLSNIDTALDLLQSTVAYMREQVTPGVTEGE